MPPLLHVTIPGLPQPQGSARAFRRGQRVIVTSANPKLAAWRDRLAFGIVASRGGRPCHRHDGPVRLEVTFALPRPKSCPKSRTFPLTRPDLDKLVRACCDSMTDAGVWRDDAQMVALLAMKTYTTDTPGVTLTAWAQED
jgi:crossover junction endodeoxyribonuclease RusA